MIGVVNYHFVCEHCGKDSGLRECAADSDQYTRGEYSTEFNGKCPHCKSRQSWENKAGHARYILYFLAVGFGVSLLTTGVVYAFMTGWFKYNSESWNAINPFVPYWFLICSALGLAYGLKNYKQIISDDKKAKTKNKPIII